MEMIDIYNFVISHSVALFWLAVALGALAVIFVLIVIAFFWFLYATGYDEEELY